MAAEEAVAAEPEDEPEDALQVEESLELASSGTWGQLKWTLDDSGLLTISGNGEMDRFDSGSREAWLAQRNSIRRVIIENGVTCIGNHAFSYCGNLTSISIPDSVTDIRYGAFRNCYSLKYIDIPTSVTHVGSDVFSCCAGLVSVTIPDSVKSLGSYLFFGCESLISATIPYGVTSIGTWTFMNCESLVSVTLPKTLMQIDWAFDSCDALKDVYYGGTEAEWNSIDIDSFNERWLSKATIHFTQPAEIPGAVTGLAASPVYTCAVRLTWDKKDGASGYQLWRAGNTGEFKWIKNCTTNCCVNYNLSGGKYRYKVRPYTGEGDSRVFGPFCSDVFVFVPGEIRELSLSCVGYDLTHANTAEIRWESSAQNTGYQVFRAVGESDDFSWLKNENYEDAYNYGLKPGTVYKYKVRSYIELPDGQRAYGRFSEVVTMFNPPIMTFTAVPGEKQITVSWEPVAGVSHYRVAYREASKTNSFFHWVNTPYDSPNTSSMTLTGLKPDTAYLIMVSAVSRSSTDNSVRGQFSETQEVKTR